MTFPSFLQITKTALTHDGPQQFSFFLTFHLCSLFSEDFLDLTIYKGQHFQTTQHLDMMWLLRETRNILPGNSKGGITGRKMFFRWLAKHTLLGVQDILWQALAALTFDFKCF